MKTANMQENAVKGITRRGGGRIDRTPEPRTPGHLVRYFVLVYLTFWVLLGATGALMALKVPSLVITIMQNVCAWAPTFVIILQFKRLFPGATPREFLKRNFLPKVKPLVFLLILAIQSGILCVAVIAQLAFTHASASSLSFLSLSSLLPAFLITATSGPMGEELGWRGFALNELQKRFTPFASAVILGVIWGFWHTPLWLMSGYTGLNLLAYIVSFLVGILCTSVVIAVFYNKHKSILIAMWIHFLFNFLLRLTGIDPLPLLPLVSAGYVVFAAILVACNRKVLLRRPQTAGARSSVG